MSIIFSNFFWRPIPRPAAISSLITILAIVLACQPAICDRFFASHLPSVPPLASYFMSTFPGTFSTSSISGSPMAMPYIGGGNGFGQQIECDFNANPVIDYILDRMRAHLTEEKIVVQNGAITIYDAHIIRFMELTRIKQSCGRKLDPMGRKVLLPFEAEIRAPQVAAKLKYNFYVTDIYGDYAGNFSHIRLNGTFEANLDEEYMNVQTFNITSSRVLTDSIVFGYVPKWILDWVRSYFDSDNTELYQQLARSILQREAESFRHFDMLREAMSSPIQGREEEDRPPLNGL